MLNNELIEVMNTCLTNDYDSYTFTQAHFRTYSYPTNIAMHL